MKGGRKYFATLRQTCEAISGYLRTKTKIGHEVELQKTVVMIRNSCFPDSCDFGSSRS